MTGHDVEEMVYALTFIDGVWTADGTNLVAAATKVAERKLSEKNWSTPASKPRLLMS